MFDLMVIDCPWSASDQLLMSDTKRGAEANYSTLSTKDLCRLPVPELMNSNGCVVALWCLGSMLPDAMEVMTAWGLVVKSTFVWVKTKKEPLKNIEDINDVLSFGMGRTFRQCHEIALIGMNNTGPYKNLKNRSQRSVLMEHNEGHSKKPEALQDRLELMFPDATRQGRALELFARRERQGWICLGNEVGQREDIRISLQKLLSNKTDESIAS